MDLGRQFSELLPLSAPPSHLWAHGRLRMMTTMHSCKPTNTPAIFARIVMACAACIACASMALAECRLQPGPRRTVTRAIDGETLRLDDGSEVRLVGALAPSAYDAGTDATGWPAAGAATAALAWLTEGHSVVLGYPGAARRDRQNRHLAQVFVVEGSAETWVQGHMLSQGHARAYQLKDARGCSDELLAHERSARERAVGLWSIAAYAVRPAIRLRDLSGMTGRFAVLTGRIAWVAEGRDAIALGFTPTSMRATSQRRGIVAMIDSRDRDFLGTFGGNAKTLEGQNVEIRGWLEQRLGRPAGTFVIDVSLAGLIRILGDEPGRTKPAAVPHAEAPKPAP